MNKTSKIGLTIKNLSAIGHIDMNITVFLMVRDAD